MTADTTSFTDGVESAGDGRGGTFPYMSFGGFRSLLDRLASDGLPQIFDRSFFGDSSGSLIAQTRGTLRFLDLIDEEKRPTNWLREITNADEPQRVAILRDLTEEKYADVIKLGANATQGQLAQTFSATGLSGASITKATTFYLGLADYVGLPVSPYFKRGPVRSPTGNGSTTRRSSRRKKPLGSPEPPPVQQVQQQPDPIGVKRSAYIDLLMKLVERNAENGQVQQDLLDRLERALGYETSPKQGGYEAFSKQEGE